MARQNAGRVINAEIDKAAVVITVTAAAMACPPWSDLPTDELRERAIRIARYALRAGGKLQPHDRWSVTIYSNDTTTCSWRV